MASPNPANYIPLRWPSQWKDPSNLDLLKGTRINYIVFDDAASMNPVRTAAEKSGLTTALWANAANTGVAAATLSEMPWKSSAPVLAINDASWPGVRLKRRGEKDSADSGPTGAPWVDANGWMIQLARAKAPDKRIWVASKPGKDEFATRPGSYMLSIAEAAAYGARWLINFDDGFSRALAARETGATEQWHRMTRAIDFFESRTEWHTLIPSATLGVISDVAGDNEFMGTEFLNLAARRNLLYRVFDKNHPVNLDGLTAAIYLDAQPPVGATHDALTSFVNNGGLLVAPVSAGFKGGANVASDVPGYSVRSMGKGRIATPVKPWEDPWMVAAEAQMLVGRRYDPVRLYNPGALAMYVALDPAVGAKWCICSTTRSHDLATTRPWRRSVNTLRHGSSISKKRPRSRCR